MPVIIDLSVEHVCRRSIMLFAILLYAYTEWKVGANMHAEDVKYINNSCVVVFSCRFMHEFLYFLTLY